ncbi:hypothetical protein [uncultured Ilyobacter sp.]|uniref:hypothetical protein n=1 Tax=uncultured Ilyobacter sp. TaxID=544433 RepID=UPI0029C68139|nr:hypothetical protein [uncultured Ilyobacter sp.]
MKKVMVYLFAATSIYCSELDFAQGVKCELMLQPEGQIRVREVFVPRQSEKEMVINNFSMDVDRNSIVVESENIGEFVFYGFPKNDNYLSSGRTVFYKGEEHKLISSNPMIIENLKSGEVIINPGGEIRIKSATKEKGNALILRDDKKILDAKINYTLGGLTWSEEYNLYLDENRVKKNIVIKNYSDKKFENVLVRLPDGDDFLDRFDLNPFTDVNKNIFDKRASISKNFIYLESREKRNPELSLAVGGLNLDSSDKVKVFDEKGYLGQFTGMDKNGELQVKGLFDRDIQVESSEVEKHLGTRLKQRKVSYSIKNYKKEAVILKIFYDKLPEKWNELRSEEVYEMIGKTPVFTLEIPGNSRKDMKFSFIEEKN